MKFWNNRNSDWREVIPGVERRILSTDKDVMLVLYKIKPNTMVARHSHTNAQHGFVIQGGGTFTFSNSKTYEVRENDAYYVPPNEEHMLLTGSEDESIFLDAFVPPREDFRHESRKADADR